MGPDGRRRGQTIPKQSGEHVYTNIAAVLKGTRAALEAMPLGTAERALRLAIIVPPFGFGSGGHQVVFGLGRALEARGHVVSYWIHDPHGETVNSSDAQLRVQAREFFGPIDGLVSRGFADWPGADVVVATGWQTVYPAMSLPLCRARAYLVNDHEPEFYPTSVESLFATRSYELGIPCIVGGGPWLAGLLAQRYGADVVARFPYAIAPELRPRPIERREDTIVVYGRDSTPRRAVGLSLIAMQELKRRRPELRIVLFGDQGMPRLSFEYEHLGRASPTALSWAYSEATVGVALSLTHGSLVPHDMMACGLPVVDLLGYGTAAEHTDDGLVELAAADPAAIAGAVERLLDDPGTRRARAARALERVATHTEAVAADRVEEGLYAIVRSRAGGPSTPAPVGSGDQHLVWPAR